MEEIENRDKFASMQKKVYSQLSSRPNMSEIKWKNNMALSSSFRPLFAPALCKRRSRRLALRRQWSFQVGLLGEVEKSLHAVVAAAAAAAAAPPVEKAETGVYQLCCFSSCEVFRGQIYYI